MNLKNQLEEDLETLLNDIEKSHQEAEQIKKVFKKIQVSVEKMVEMFKRSRFFLAVAQKMSYDEGFIFTENNIIQYLAELEEYISSLITYSAFKREEPNAAISVIPLEKLNQKDHDKKELAIDTRIVEQINQDIAQPSENDEIISSKQLY